MPFKKADINNIYNKDKKLKKEDVQSLLGWISMQPHLPKITELQVILFLQSCYYSNEAAKNTLDIYFTVKTLCPDIFGNRNPNDPSLIRNAEVTLMTPLQKRTKENYTVMFMRLLDCDPDNYNFANQIRKFDMTTLLHLHMNGPCDGIVIVIDMLGTVFGHVTKLSIVVVKKFLYYLQEAMPIRLKGVHFINVVPFMDKIMAILKPFMKKELIEMLYIHTDSIEGLYKFVPKECLPKELGGDSEPFAILHEKNKQLMHDCADFFAFEETQVVDESKRPGRPKNAGDIFGMEGTFKKLEVD